MIHQEPLATDFGEREGTILIRAILSNSHSLMMRTRFETSPICAQLCENGFSLPSLRAEGAPKL